MSKRKSVLNETPPSPPPPRSAEGFVGWLERRPGAFELEAGRLEYIVMTLPFVVCVVAMVLHLLPGEIFSIYDIARPVQRLLCAPGDFLVMCIAPETTWDGPTSLLVLINATLILSALACMAAVVVRKRRGDLVFRRRPAHKGSAVFILVITLGFAWGFFFYRHRDFVNGFLLGFISIFVVDAIRFALASLLVPTPTPTPASPREKIRNGWFGKPLRQARFAPGVETGETSREQKDKKI